LSSSRKGFGLAVIAALAALATAVPVASAAPCHLTTDTGASDPTAPALFDPLGYYFDTREVQTAPGVGVFTSYAAFDDSGANGPSDTPAGPFSNSDSYDWWGQLFVGAQDADHQYTDTDPNGCAVEADGRQLAYAAKDAGGLRVQRKLLVSSTTGSGARIVELVTNTGTAPVTTSVYVGDLTTQDSGDLGSDGATHVTDSSSSDGTMTAADSWAVTTDGSLTTGDNALAHVWDGPGGAEKASLAQQGGPALDAASTLGNDQIGYAWQNVTIAPGQTAAYLSWELQRTTANGFSADAAPLAAQAAKDLQASALSQIYEGLTTAEVAAVRNWAKPAVSGDIAPVPAASSVSDTTLSATGVDFAGGVSQCSQGTYAWDFGDGTAATGATVVHRFAAGTANVKLTLTNPCGSSKTATASFAVASPPPPPPPVVVVAKVSQTGKVKVTRKGHKILVDTGIKVSCPAGGAACSAVASARTLKAVAARKVHKSKVTLASKTFKIAAGKTQRIVLTLSSKGAKALKRNKKLRVKVTVVARVGNNAARTTTRTITIKQPKAAKKHKKH
jgi:hypothetical protein